MEVHLPFRIEPESLIDIPVASPLIIRQMTDEERAKYPAMRPTQADFRQCIHARLTLEQIAEKYGIAAERALRLAGIYKLAHLVPAAKPVQRPKETMQLRAIQPPAKPKREKRITRLLEEFPRERVIDALREHRTHRRAANKLGIECHYWFAMVKHYGLQVGSGRRVIEKVSA